MNVFGYNSNNIFDQDLNTDDSVSFASVTVSDAITLSQQLATKLYVDTHGGGGGLTYSGVTPATNKIYKASSATGLDATNSSISDDGSLVTVSAVNGITAPKIIKTGGTGIQYLMGDGSTLTQSATSGNSNFYLYQSKNGITTPPPASGDVGYNNSNQSLATIVYISHLTRDNIDIELFYKQVNSLSDLYIQDQNNSVNFIKYNITGLPSPVINSYISIPVLAISSGGTGATSFGSNHNVLLAFFSNLTEVDTRLSTLETNTQNQTAVSLVTTFNDTVTVPIINVQGIGSLSGNINDYVSIGTGSNYVQISSGLGITSNNYIVNSATSSQFLKGDGTLDSNTYVSEASLLENLNTNRLNNALSILPMTSNILPAGYTASSSGNYSIGTDAWNAFSQTASYFQSTLNNYNGASGVYVGVNTTLITGLGSTLGDWLQIQLPSVINVASYTLDGTNGNTQRNPSTFYFLYSLDNINWIIADTRTAYQWISPYSATFTLATPVTAKYFRISVSLVGNTGIVVNRNCIQVNELTLNQPLGTVQVPTLLSNKTTFSDANELVTKGYVATYGSTIVQGMPFNSIYGNTTTAPTGTRSLWYTAITPYATTINGIMIYVDGGGSDTTHFGIYRGYLKAGVGTNPGLNMTLIGQSASSTILSTGLPYNRVPLVVIGGQSLAFTSGEYLTIAFHASGTSNTFLSSPTGFSSVGLCYTTLTNYATTTFPATITNSSISTSSTQRICFDLY